MKDQDLLRDPDFIKLWGGQAISTLGSHITGGAIPLLAVITLQATPAQMGLLNAFGSAPVIFFGLFAGVWVDRLRRRPMMIAADLGRAFILAAIPLLAVFGLLQVWQVYLVTALAGTLTVFFQVAYRSYLPSLVKREKLVEGNSRLALSDSIAEVIGPGLSGVLVQTITAPIAILFDALSFIISAASIVWIRKPEPPVEQPHSNESPIKEAVSGLALVLRDPILRALAGQEATSTFFGTFIGVLYALYGIRVLNLTAFEVGLTVAVGGASSILGAFFASRLARRFGLGRTMVVTLFTGTLLTLLIPFAASVGPYALLFLLLEQSSDISYTTYSIHAISVRQSIAPPAMLGRVNASMDLLAGGVAPLGALAGGILAEQIGIQQTLFVAVGGLFLAFLWILFSPISRLKNLE